MRVVLYPASRCRVFMEAPIVNSRAIWGLNYMPQDLEFGKTWMVHGLERKGGEETGGWKTRRGLFTGRRSGMRRLALALPVAFYPTMER